MRFGTAMGRTLQRKRKFARFISLRKQPTFGDATTEFSAKWRLRNERRNSTPMTRHYPDLGSASDWMNQISHEAPKIWSTTQIWVLRRHQYGISALVSQTSFRWETSGGVAKCPLFSQVISLLALDERSRGSIWMKKIFARDGAVPWCLHGLLFTKQKVNILEKGGTLCRLQDLLDFTY